MICLCSDKDQWQDQFPMMITMLSRGEGWTTRIVLEHVTICELLEVGANWEPFLDATISDCVLSFTYCFQWIKELQNLKTLTFSHEHPSLCCRDVAPSLPTPIPCLDVFSYHPEASTINVLMDGEFINCVNTLCHNLRRLDITTSESDINGVYEILNVCKNTLEHLELRVIGCEHTYNNINVINKLMSFRA